MHQNRLILTVFHQELSNCGVRAFFVDNKDKPGEFKLVGVRNAKARLAILRQLKLGALLSTRLGRKPRAIEQNCTAEASDSFCSCDCLSGCRRQVK